MLERPERVPFRLTPNLVDALGISGVEGLFRRSSEECMRILRNHQDMLMNVLQTFVHDPLVEWKEKDPRARQSSGGKRAGVGGVEGEEGEAQLD